MIVLRRSGRYIATIGQVGAEGTHARVCWKWTVRRLSLCVQRAADVFGRRRYDQMHSVVFVGAYAVRSRRAVDPRAPLYARGGAGWRFINSPTHASRYNPLQFPGSFASPTAVTRPSFSVTRRCVRTSQVAIDRRSYVMV